MTGQREFGRNAVVGLASSTYGTVTLGRQYDPVVDLVQGLTQNNYFGGVFATPGDLENYDNSLRVSNSVKYTSPLIAGFQFAALYGFGGVAGAAGSGRTYSFGASYANGVHTWSSSSDTLFNTVINQGFSSAKTIQIVRVAGQYVAGPATFGLAYSNTQYGADTLSASTGTRSSTTAPRSSTGSSRRHCAPVSATTTRR